MLESNTESIPESIPESNTENYAKMDVNRIDELPIDYPEDFNSFCLTHGLKPPDITSGNGKALSVMLKFCDQFKRIQNT